MASLNGKTMLTEKARDDVQDHKTKFQKTQDLPKNNYLMNRKVGDCNLSKINKKGNQPEILLQRNSNHKKQQQQVLKVKKGKK